MPMEGQNSSCRTSYHLHFLHTLKVFDDMLYGTGNLQPHCTPQISTTGSFSACSPPRTTLKALLELHETVYRVCAAPCTHKAHSQMPFGQWETPLSGDINGTTLAAEEVSPGAYAPTSIRCLMIRPREQSFLVTIPV